MEKVYIVYKMRDYIDGKFPEFVGVYSTPQPLTEDELQDEVDFYNAT